MARFSRLESFEHLRSHFDTLRPGEALRVRGDAGSLPAFVLADILKKKGGPLIALLPTSESADYLRSDLEQLLPPEEVLFFPPSGQEPYDSEQLADTLPLVQRTDALGRLREGFEGILVTSAEAIAELVPPPEAVTHETLTLAIGEEHPPEELMERLTGQGFLPVEFVEGPGELALRGGILDVFPFAGEYPIRLEFFGDEIDSIRAFDPANQRSVSRLESARLVPNLDGSVASRGKHPATPSASPRQAGTPLDFLPPEAPLALFDSGQLIDAAAEVFSEASEAFEQLGDKTDVPPPKTRYLTSDALDALLSERKQILFGTFSKRSPNEVDLGATPQPSVGGKIDRLREEIQRHKAQAWETAILCDSPSQKNRLWELLGGNLETGDPPNVTLMVESLHEGFELPNAEIAVYTDHEIFDRYHRPTRRRAKAKGGLTLRDVQGLSPGDFVVHVDYGIGRFAGLVLTTVRGQRQEVVRLVFRDDDELLVSVSALHKLAKYTGKEGHQPRLTKLGTGAWERLKGRTKKRVKDIARDLIQIYAKRRAADGFAFQGDMVWQREMEASFPFEETPDQIAAIDAVKADMEEAIPMDRLVCGDVGFGKTEIAIRAAFKAVQDGKQVAVVAPTTILVRQHVETFKERMGRFPITIRQLSRFVSRAGQKKTIEELKAGTVDIVIGTQRVLSKDVAFRDLGLLIVDEEQRFGVSAKEKLRKLRPNVDTLTLTATPIPRTLQFSLLGARDLSLIQTPPANRQPVVTEIHTRNSDLIRDAILYEIGRGGQVFFLHNRVRTIEQVTATIQAQVPDVRVRFAHGQMKSSELESVMLDFMDRRFDVLVCTNIVESGLDVSNANTIIIDHAERFGLSDLHQLRGRVGRSERKAFCYLLVPSIHALTREARQRLRAVEEFSDLGAGFNISMRDLDIRGAGNLLGAEQSGFIEDVGYETYHNILDEAVKELRSEEFSEVFEDQAEAPPATESTVDADVETVLPEDYVANNVERLNLYRRLAGLENEEEIDTLETELEDRFGNLPEPARNLLALARMKPPAQRLRLPRVTWKNQRLFLRVPDQDADPFFYETVFEPLLEALAQLENRYVLKDSKRSGALRAIVQEVSSLEEAGSILNRLAQAALEPTPA